MASAARTPHAPSPTRLHALQRFADPFDDPLPLFRRRGPPVPLPLGVNQPGAVLVARAAAREDRDFEVPRDLPIHPLLHGEQIAEFPLQELAQGAGVAPVASAATVLDADGEHLGVKTTRHRTLGLNGG